MMLKSLRRGVRDAVDIARRARGVGELGRALLPPAWLKRRVLNPRSADGAGDAAATAVALRKLRNRLKVDAIDDRGRVDYRRLRDPDVIAELESAAGALHAVTPEALNSDAERLAFWLNLYNVLGIHGVIALGIEDSVMERPSFFSVVAYRVGQDTFTLDEIENGVLRRNSPHPATRQRLFKKADSRLRHCPERLDPRIHAALVCCSASCPPVAFYDAEHVDEQLKLAARSYVASEVSVDTAARSILLPITFDYYASDWGDAGAIRTFVLAHAEGTLRGELEGAFADGYAVDYRRYDWSLNTVV